MNIFDKLRFVDQESVMDHLFHSPILRVERLATAGQDVKFYSKQEDQLIYLVKGSALVKDQDDRLLELKPGELLYLEAGESYELMEGSSECAWLCFNFPPQEGARFFSSN